MQFNLFK